MPAWRREMGREVEEKGLDLREAGAVAPRTHICVMHYH
jgi:hypothetical protein